LPTARANHVPIPLGPLLQQRLHARTPLVLPLRHTAGRSRSRPRTLVRGNLRALIHTIGPSPRGRAATRKTKPSEFAARMRVVEGNRHAATKLYFGTTVKPMSACCGMQSWSNTAGRKANTIGCRCSRTNWFADKLLSCRAR
jgi:hypothetical protein